VPAPAPGAVPKVVGATVRGPIHRRAGQPNQDALAWLPPSGSGDFLVVAVADGHGGSKGFRSEIGANLAVDVAMEALVQRVPGLDPSILEERPGSWWPLLQEITGCWATAARADLAEQPFTERELQRLKEEATGGTDELARNPLLAYGSTLITVAVTPTVVYYLQLGDGDILTVWPGGEVRRPIPVDQRLIGNETTSLCLDNAWREFRVAADLAGRLPRMVLMCTDGYANSFRDEGGFEQVGTDLLPIVERHGLDAVAERLEGWLTETAQQGAGDDATLAVISLPPTSA
jgi:serine/threonine protein phosphatase PrpC